MINIQLHDMGASVEIVKDTAKIVKTVSISTLQSILMKNVPLDTSVLPYGTVAYKKISGHQTIAILHPGSIREVKFEMVVETSDNKVKRKVEEFTIPTPHLLWLFSLNDAGRIEGTELYSIKDLVFTEKTILHRYPFSNCGQDGHVCWGNNDIIHTKQFEKLVGLTYMPSLFFEQAFNADLDNGFGFDTIKTMTFGNKLPTNLKSKSGTYLLFLKLDGMKEFPYDILVSNHEEFRGVWNEI